MGSYIGDAELGSVYGYGEQTSDFDPNGGSGGLLGGGLALEHTSGPITDDLNVSDESKADAFGRKVLFPDLATAMRQALCITSALSGGEQPLSHGT